MNKLIGIFVGGLVLIIFAFASPAAAALTASPSPSPSSCPAGQFMSPLGCTLIGSGSGTDGGQSPVTHKRHIAKRHVLPLTGSPVPVGTFALIGFGLIIAGGACSTAGNKR